MNTLESANAPDDKASSESNGGFTEWRFHHIFLIVTGKTEERYLPEIFRPLVQEQRCHFKVMRRIPQFSPIVSQKRNMIAAGTGKKLTKEHFNQISYPARTQMRRTPDCLIILIDDLEHERRAQAEAVFDLYRGALSQLLDDNQKRNVSVHFLVPMLEAYFLADAKAVNEALGTTIQDYAGDVEDIRNPKGEIKDAFPTYQEIEDGGKILQALDAEHILSRAETCAFLRTLFAWCIRKMDGQLTDQYRLKDGRYAEITQTQISG